MTNPHYDHDIVIWENSDYIVNLGNKTQDIGNDGGFDDNTPLHCLDCNTDLEPDEEFEMEIQDAIGNL